jgi:antitoxin HigA-1
MTMTMHNPPHAGLILSEMWLKPLGLTITKAAAQLNVSRKTLSEVVNAHAAVTPEMALRLEIAFGKSADSWLGHQSAYDLWTIKESKKPLGVVRYNANNSQTTNAVSA